MVLSVEPATLPWVATANSPWLQLSGGSANGSSSATVVFTVEANPGGTRTGSLTIAGQTLNITQAGGTFSVSSALTTLVGTGLSSPTDVAVDAAGNVYIVDRTSSSIRKWTRASNTTNTLINVGLNLPNAIAIDAAGNLFIADSGNNAIKKWSVNTGLLTPVVTNGLANPTGIAVDLSGNVYIADRNNNAIKKWSALDSNVITLVATNLNAPIGVAVDFAANVYIADTFNGAIKKWNPANSNVTTIISTGLNTPSDLAVDYAGNIYIANTTGGNIRKWTAASGVVSTIASTGLLQPSGVAVDDTGNVYIASTGNTQVRQLPRAYVDTAARTISASAGVDSFVAALPATVNLLAPFAPVSNQPWLTIAGASNGNLTINYSTNSGPNRSATLTVLGLNLGVTQLTPPVPEIGVSQPAGNNLLAGATTNDFGPGLLAATNLSKTFLITNSGGANLSGLNLTVDGANPADFLLGNLGSANLAPNATTSFTVSFKPTALGNRAAILHIANNDPDENPFDIALVGVGIPAAYSLAYSNLNVGPQLLSTNLTLTATPTNAPWNVTSDSAWLTANLASGLGSTNLSLTIATNPGALRIGTLTIANLSLVVTQAALPRPEIGVLANNGDLISGANRDFGIGAVLVTNSTQSFTITNSGNTNLTGLALTKSGANAADFLVSALGSSTLAPGSATSFSISFAPATVGNKSALLQIASNDSDENPFMLNLTGTAVTPAFRFATTNRVVGPTAGADSVVFSATPATATWTATTATPWLHLNPGSQSGSGSATIVFTIDANAGATRTGAIVAGGQTLTIVQAGTGYVSTTLSTPLATAELNAPYGIAVGPSGDVFIADSEAQSIKRWSPTNNSITTLINSGLSYPAGVATDAAGNVYLADTLNGAIKKWTAANNSVSTLLASGLSNPYGIAVDAAGNVYLADTFNNAIKRWSVTNGAATTLISNGLQSPFGIAVDAAANVYIADTYNNSIKRYHANSGTTTTLVNSGLNFPYDVAVDVAGNVYIADSENNAVKKWIAASSSVVTIPTGPISTPFGVAVDPSGHLFLSDSGNNLLRCVPRAFVNATARNVGFAAGTDSLPTVLPASANLRSPFDPTSDQPWLTITSVTNGVISFAFSANPNGTARTANLNVLGQTVAVTQAALPYSAALATTNWTVGAVAGSDSVTLQLTPITSSNWTATANAAWLHVSSASVAGDRSTNVIYSFDANPGPTRSGTLTIANQILTVTQVGNSFTNVNLLTNVVGVGLNQCAGVAVDSAGNVIIADTYGNAIKRWNIANNTVSTLVSTGLSLPNSIAVDQNGNIVIADTYGLAVKRWSPLTGQTTTLVSGLGYPTGVAIDLTNNVIIADHNNYAIKRWNVADGSVTTLINTGLNLPTAVAVDAAGAIYIADRLNNAIKKWTPETGAITTLVGTGLNNPSGVAVDVAGNVFIADRFNNAIKKWIAASNVVTTVIGTGLNQPLGVAVNAVGDVSVADTYNSIIKAFPRAFVDQATKTVGNAAATLSLPVVLPVSANLGAPFNPTSNQPWLTSNPSSSGNVNFSVTANSGSARSAILTVLGRPITINQTLVITSPQLTATRAPAGLVLSFAANSGQTYQIESAPAVTGPWVTNAVLVGAPGGFLNYTNPISNVGNRFFRTRTP